MVVVVGGVVGIESLYGDEPRGGEALDADGGGEQQEEEEEAGGGRRGCEFVGSENERERERERWLRSE